MNWLIVGWIVCQGLDLGSTAYGLHQGLREGNPLLAGSPGRTYGIKIGLNLGMGAYHLKVRSAHQRIIPISMAISGCAAASLNGLSLVHHGSTRSSSPTPLPAPQTDSPILRSQVRIPVGLPMAEE